MVLRIARSDDLLDDGNGRHCRTVSRVDGARGGSLLVKYNGGRVWVLGRCRCCFWADQERREYGCDRIPEAESTVTDCRS
jgi:hypothetical protein